MAKRKDKTDGGKNKPLVELTPDHRQRAVEHGLCRDHVALKLEFDVRQCLRGEKDEWD